QLLRLDPRPPRCLRLEPATLPRGCVAAHEAVLSGHFEYLREMPERVIDRPVRESALRVAVALLLRHRPGFFDLRSLARLRDFVRIDKLRRDLTQPVTREEGEEVV